MIRIRPFAIADALSIDPRPIYPKDVKELYVKQSVFGRSFTLYESNDLKVLACVTLCFLRPGLAGINMLCDNSFVRQKKEFIYVLRESIKYYMEELKLKRVQATIRADFPGAEKWIKIVGFEKEGVMKSYGPEGEDHFLFAKVVV